jgi:beta-phosphoglucomutase
VREWLGDRPDLDAIVQQRIDRYVAAAAGGGTIRPATAAAVRRAAARVPLAVVSGATRAEIEPVVAAAGLGGCFLAIVDGTDPAFGKPHPESYELALRALGAALPGLAAPEVVAFEDTQAGVQSAKAAGLRCLALAGTMTPERLAAADEVVTAVDPALVDRLLGAAA